jgi:hypothetical protein
MDIDTALPRIDEHEISVNVPAPVAWAAVVTVFERLTTKPAWRLFAQAIRCTPDRASGTADTAGTALPGFMVVASETPTEWALEGEHLFSRYALTFRITPLDGEHCRITAHTSAEFPGLHGTLYRALVISSGGHMIGVRSILRNIKAEAERSKD